MPNGRIKGRFVNKELRASEREEEAQKLSDKCTRIEKWLRATAGRCFTVKAPLKARRMHLGAVEHLHGGKESLKKAASINLDEGEGGRKRGLAAY